jgi:hypothetical protein
MSLLLARLGADKALRFWQKCKSLSRLQKGLVMKKVASTLVSAVMPRRRMLAWLATGAVAAATVGAAAATSGAAETPALDVPGALEGGAAANLRQLTAALAAAPRRRDFKTVPMILDHPRQWDSAALELLLHYRGGPKQVWDNTDIASPWLNLMRNAMNAQVWSYRQPDFLAVSATHGTCHLALFDEVMWDKYDFPAMIKNQFKRNIFLTVPPAVRGKNAGDFNDPHGLFSPAANCIPLLVERGAVFLACHNMIWEFSHALIAKGHNPDHLNHERLAADLTNHLIPGAILTPGIVATIPLLEAAGYRYIK